MSNRTEIAITHVPRKVSGMRVTLVNQACVLRALILHDIKSRYFGNGLGYILMILWPFGHLALLMALHIISHRATPFGTSGLLYVSTGVYPFIIWNYISRFAMLGVMMNKSYLSYPIINLLDILTARIILEINTSYIILVVLLLFLYMSGVPIMPIYIQKAVLGVIAAAVCGIGCGVLGGVISGVFPMFSVIWIVPIVVCYSTSGILINPEFMPYQIAQFFYWNPLVHCVEMVRSGYYQDYPTRLLDIKYPFIVGITSLTIGLVSERIYSRF